MRYSQKNTKREKAITAAILDVLAAQLRSESENACLTYRQSSALDTYRRGIENIAEELFAESQAGSVNVQPWQP